MAQQRGKVDIANTRTSSKLTLDRLNKSPVGDILARVDQFLSKRRIKAYLVGGVVRDILLNRETGDIDIAVSGKALDVAAKAAEEFGGCFVPLDEQNGVGRVVLANKLQLDFSSLEGGIEEDLARRDFTVNAMAVDLSLVLKGEARVIDPFNGRSDLRRRLVRAVCEGVFAADSVRLLRAVRISAELDFKIIRQTASLIRRDAHLIKNTAGERIREELLRILAVPDCGLSLSLIDNLRLLTVIFPELAVTKGVEQPREHFWDVFEHSLKTVAAVDFLLRQGTWEYKGKRTLSAVPWSATLKQYFAEEVSHGSTRRSLLKLAGLLHDIAKPQSKSVEEGGRIRFLGHDKEGASVAAAMLAKLRFSTREIKLVEAVIEHHMRPTQMSQEGMPTPRAIYRFFRDTEDAGIDILFLSLADHLAARGPNLDLDHWREHTGVVEYVLDRRFEQESVVRPPKLIDGHDLINIFGQEPGPEIGRTLEAVREAQAVGEIKTKSEALKLVKRLLYKS